MRKIFSLISWLILGVAALCFAVAIIYLVSAGEGRGGPAGVVVLFVLGASLLIVGGGALLVWLVIKFILGRSRKGKGEALQENKESV